MDKVTLLEKLNQELGFKRPVNQTDVLQEIEEWDSLAFLSVLNVFDDNGLVIDIGELESCQSIDDILSKGCK